MSSSIIQFIDLSKIVYYNLAMIKREMYLNKIRDFYDTNLIKVITGIRRCGKSVILNEIMDEIKEKTNNIIYLNFERMSDLNKVKDYLGLINYVNKNKKNGKCYLFFDEIQLLDKWEIAIKDLRLDDTSIFITGSNSKLLSKEIMSLLSGRFIEIKIRPFVYKEIVEYSKELNKEISINDYLIYGGFPARFELNSLERMKDYLNELMETIIYNDLIKRYKIKKEVEFKKIVSFILLSPSRIISARSIYRAINNECSEISLSTVIKYLEYLKSAYIIEEIPRYNKRIKKELSYYYKIYNTDVSFSSILKLDNRFDIDHNLENIVYNELLFRGYKIFNYDNNGKEIDFYAIKNNKEYYIQVAHSVVDEKAYKREFEAFASLDYRSQKILITMDEIDYSTSLIRHISLKDFLMMEDF